MLPGARACRQWHGSCPHTARAEEKAAGSGSWRQVCFFKTQLPRCRGPGNVCVITPYTIITLLGVIKRGFVILLRWSFPFPPLNHERQLWLQRRQWEHPGAGRPRWVHQSSQGPGSLPGSFPTRMLLPSVKPSELLSSEVYFQQRAGSRVPTRLLHGIASLRWAAPVTLTKLLSFPGPQSSRL